ncbi:MAG: leucine-rich repeat domain-containing protein [Candidatus Onthomorpha sp.]
MKNQNFGKPLCRFITMVAICMLSLNAMAWDFSYTHQGKTLYYNITSSNTVCVTYYSSDNYFQSNNYVSGDVVIPSSVTNNDETYSVTSISDYAFSKCSSLVSITIPESVTIIGDYTFDNCSSLASVSIPESVTTIGRYAFRDCSSLTSITIPESVTTIGNSAFENCSGLRTLNFNATNCTDFSSDENEHPFSSCPINTIDIGNSVQRIPANFAYGISNLTSTTIGNSVTSIGDSAFWNCSSLSTINFNATNCNDFSSDANEHPFSSCPITTIDIGNSVQRIPANFAYGISNLISATIGNSVTSIGDSAFWNCSSLNTLNFDATNCNDFSSDANEHPFSSCPITTINLGNSVQRIPANFARSLSGLTSATIGNSVTAIGDSAFWNCSSLSTLNFNATNCNDFTSEENNYPFSSCPITIINIGDSVQRIPMNFAYNLDSLTSIRIPNNVISIGERAFADCSSLATLRFNAKNCNDFNSDENEHPFSSCPIAIINIGDSVQRIPMNFAYNLDSLTSIRIPNNVISIGERAFADCSSLATLRFNAKNCNDFNSDENEHPFSSCPIAIINIGDSIQGIPANFARSLSSLTSVTIGNSVTSIGDSAFWNCSSLSTLNFNATNCTDFSSDANKHPFSSCPIDTINIGNSVQRIPANFARSLSGLTSVTIGNSVTAIGDSAFWNCSSLGTLNFNATNCNDFSSDANKHPFSSCPVATINIGSSVQRIPANFARSLSGLTSVTIGNSVTAIGDSAFWNCSSLGTLNFNATNCNDFSSDANKHPFSSCPVTTINIGNSVQRIPANFARSLSGLTSVTIGNRVTTIGDSAFWNCSSLSTLNFDAKNCTDFSSDANEHPFSSCPITTINIGNSVQKIPANFARSLSGLTSVTVGNSVTLIGDSAFWNCSSLSTLNFNAKNCADFSSDENKNPFSSCPIGTISIGDSVQRIPANFARGINGLTTITIENNVTSIGNNAFENCSNLLNLNFNAKNCADFSLDENEHPFSSCPIVTINIGDSVQRIPTNFARSLSRLTSVTIGNSVTSIGYYAFQNCTSLSTLNFNAINCSGFTAYISSPFSSCPISTINIGESVERIPAYFTYNISNLTSITIPNSVTSIGNYAFYGCNGLTSIVSKAVVPPVIDGSEVFPNPNSCNVAVPCGSLEAYTSSEWNNYFPNRIEEDCSVSLQEVESIGEFVLYPNPSSGFVTIEFVALQESSSLRVADLGGKVVKTFDIAAGTESIRLDLRDLPSGVYTLMIGNTTKKLIVE